MYYFGKAPAHANRALSALLLGFLMTPVANAQSGADEPIEEVVVTGSRIVDSNLVSSSSVTVLNAEEVDIRGVTRVEDLVNTLPQSLAGQTSASGTSGAQATVNLRGLGASRTLVLIDGKRLPYGSPINSAPDLNQIPSQLVKSVEVLTGGATAVYGADAVAGVVNFKMNRDFEGFEANFQGSAFQSSNNNSDIERVLADFNQPDADSIIDGESYDIGLIAGTNFEGGRGNITAYYQYSRDQAVRWEDRDITSCPFGTRDGGNDFSCSGSGAQPRLTRYTRTGAGGFDLVVDETTGMLRNFNQSTDAFNFALGNYLQRPRERSSYGTFTRFELNDNTEFFLDFSVADNSTTAQIAPSGLLQSNGDSINCDNPLLSAEQLGVFCDPSVVFTDAEGIERAPLFVARRSNLDFSRNMEFGLKTQRVVAGLRGLTFGDFNYEIFGQHSKVDYRETILNDISRSRVSLATDIVADPITGDPVCRSVLNGVDPSCVPFDVFSSAGITAAASNYATTPALRVGSTEQLMFGGTLTGDLGFSVPGADSPVATAVGFEMRRDSLTLTPDSSDTGTSIRTPVTGEIEVFELYAEVLAPLVQGKTLVEDLTLTAAYRFSDYNTTGTQNTYSYGLSWSPIEDLRVRGQYQRATRSPNPIELFIPQDFGRSTLSAGANGLHDPCAGDFDPATTTPEPSADLAACQFSGVTAAQYGQILDVSTGEIPTLTGGNPNLEPELSDTWTYGIVYTPNALPGLDLSIDYFSIEVEGFVGTIPAQFALEQCLDTGDSRFCNLVNRGTSGTLFLAGDPYIETTNINTGTLNTSGFDVSASYGFDLPRFGDRMTVRYLSTILEELSEVTLPGDQPFDCVGMHGGGCGTPVPEYRHRVSADWFMADWMATLTWRYYSEVDQFSASPTAVNKLESVSYLDLSARYDLSDTIQLRGGINNLLEQDPPLTSLAGYGGDESTGRGNTFPQLYDAQGRYIFAGATISF